MESIFSDLNEDRSYLEGGYRSGIPWTAFNAYISHMGVTKVLGDVIIKLVKSIDSVYVSCANEEVSRRIQEQNKT